MKTQAFTPRMPRRFGRRFAPVDKLPVARPVATKAQLVAVTDPQLGVTGRPEEREVSHG